MTGEMEIDRFIVSDIRVGEDRRAIDPKRVEALAKSIEDIGLQTPITVWTMDHDGATHSAVHLVAGLHRLEAYKKLGLKLIEAFRTSGGELDRDLWQIDENLMRSDLTELERADHLKRRKEIIKAKEKLGGRNPPTLTGRGHKGFAADAEHKVGMSKRRINEAIRRAEKITPDAQEAIKDMPAADVGVELDAIADLNSWDQGIAVGLVKSGEAKNFREAKAFLMPDHEARKADRARVREVRKRIRESNAETMARAVKRAEQRRKTGVATPGFEEREEAAAKSDMADTLDEMATFFEKERAELRRVGFVAGDNPDQKREQSQLDSLKTAWRSASDTARGSFVEWAVDALRLGMKNRAAAGGAP